jgi:fucose 4-O-acetylase-like acetyltransferase
MSVGRRVKYIDIARGIAILCIILGHFGVEQVDRVVFTFHVPMFYFITGYFMSQKYDGVTFLKEKVRALLVPYAITCVISILLATGFALANEGVSVIETVKQWSYAALYGSGGSYTEPFYIKGIGAIWFLLATFWGSLFLRISLEMKKKVRLLFVLALFLIGYWTAKELFWFPFSIQAGCCAVSFMYIGYLVKRSKQVYEELPKEVKRASVVFALAIWLAFIKNFESFWLVHNDMGRGVIDILGSVCACFIIVQISKLIEKYTKILSGILAYFGKYSLLVLCVHILELNTWWHIENMVFGMDVGGLLTKCIISGIRIICVLVVAYICSRIKFITKLFGIKSVK